MGFLGGVVVKNLPVNAEDARDTGLISRSGSYPGVGNGNPWTEETSGSWGCKELDVAEHTHTNI